MKFVCRACGGAYESPLADGSDYYHACAPVRNPEYRPVPEEPPADVPEWIERPGHRDENVVMLHDDQGEGRRIPKGSRPRAEGAGRDEKGPRERGR